ncbi:MAG: hypothetical protein ACRC8S_04835 [Fimbriiglobus sp.]
MSRGWLVLVAAVLGLSSSGCRIFDRDRPGLCDRLFGRDRDQDSERDSDRRTKPKDCTKPCNDLLGAPVPPSSYGQPPMSMAPSYGGPTAMPIYGGGSMPVTYAPPSAGYPTTGAISGPVYPGNSPRADELPPPSGGIPRISPPGVIEAPASPAAPMTVIPPSTFPARTTGR